jgi:transcriptional regulator with XRE-family HTH domain
MEPQRQARSPQNQTRNLLRRWRALRGTSQLVLAANADISQRHLSFIESGRARPSREMVLRIAEALDLPLRVRNDLLLSAGFAAIYPERSLLLSEMAHARDALERILRHHDPYPAMVLDRAWNIVLKNEAATRIIAKGNNEEQDVAELNFMRLFFDPKGLRPHVAHWERTATVLVARLRREARANPGCPSETLLADLLPQAPAICVPEFDDVALEPMVLLELHVGDDVLRLFNTLTTFGTPQDITLADLRIEMSFPADDASEALLRHMAGTSYGDSTA